MIVPVVTAALAGLLALAAYAGPIPLAAAVLAVQGAFLGSWHRYVGAPGAAGGVAVGGLTALGCLAVVGVRSGDLPLVPLAPVVGLAVVLALLHQLCRRHPRDRVVASLSATVSGATVAGLGALLLPSAATVRGAAFLATALAGAVAGALVLALPGSRPGLGPRGLLAVLGGGLAGAAVAVLGETIGAAPGALAGAVAAVGSTVAGMPSRGAVLNRLDVVRLPVAGSLPVLLAGTTAYVLAALVTD
jgi:hypothetical protein